MSLLLSLTLLLSQAWRARSLQMKTSKDGQGNSHPYDHCHELQVGSSETNTVTVALPSPNLFCPRTVSSINWIGDEKYGDEFNVTQTGRSVVVRRIDSDVGWGMNLRFRCCGECVTLHVGSSESNTKATTIPSAEYVCPATVTRDNWLGGETWGDRFNTSQSGTDVSVTRIDAGAGWGMDPQFRCCRAQPKLQSCLFLHGAMVKGAWPPHFKTWYGDVSGALRTYWGPFNHWYADLCTEFIYSWADTTHHAWDNIQLQVHYADKAAEVIANGGVVFAHSMANTILAGACWRLNKCVQWYGLGGGFSGQAVGNAALEILRSAGGVGSHMVNDEVFVGFNFEAHGMRHDLEASNRNAMAKVVDKKKLLKGSLCGIQPQGNNFFGDHHPVDWGLDFPTILKAESLLDQFTIGVAMVAVSEIISNVLRKKGDDTRNDGLVEVEACAFWENETGRNWYGTGREWPTVGPKADPTETHILAEINHIEECGVFPQTPVAMNWMRNMMCKELQLSGRPCPSKSISMEWPAPSGKIGEACHGDSCSDGDCCSSNLHSICQHKQKDWFGVEYCPAECAGAPGFAGTCENEEFTSIMNRPRKVGEPCIFPSDCENWLAADPVGCCRKVCTPLKKDWAHTSWCPEECVGEIFGPPGSC